MVFNSFAEMESYIKSRHKQAMKVIAEKEKKELQNEVRKQIYNAYTPTWSGEGWEGRTGDTYNNIQYQLGGDTIVLRLEDTHSWYSVYNPNKRVYAFEMLEQGYTWGRGSTNIKSTVINKLSKEIPKVYKSTMNSLGVPVR